MVSKGEQYTFLKVAILSFWGKEKSWMTYMMCQDSPYQRTAPFLGILEILAGLPVQIDFIGFEEAENGALLKIYNSWTISQTRSFLFSL